MRTARLVGVHLVETEQLRHDIRSGRRRSIHPFLACGQMAVRNKQSSALLGPGCVCINKAHAARAVAIIVTILQFLPAKRGGAFRRGCYRHSSQIICWPLAGESSVLAHCPCTSNKLALKCTNPTRHVLSAGAVRSTTSRARWRMLQRRLADLQKAPQEMRGVARRQGERTAPVFE